MCNSKGRLTPDLYSQTMAAANMSHTLYKDGPFLVGLADCTFVAETFDEINEEHCSNMRLYTSHVFIGLMLLSLAYKLMTCSFDPEKEQWIKLEMLVYIESGFVERSENGFLLHEVSGKSLLTLLP
ncbi:Envelope glycoprotein B [Senna tora]|uniref:Envelope glycoprotein B n=1 Tax=Senna tora TaxID=362788 RepID=A0A834T5X7_9FABA|nr:Envelope glycoprotein B [Senna tora]